jgi:hypothetical protein
MSSSNGAATDGAGAGASGGGSEKIPAIITTAHLLLRGLIPAFVGCSIGITDNDINNNNDVNDGGGVRASAFQMTYRKDLPKLGVHGE